MVEIGPELPKLGVGPVDGPEVLGAGVRIGSDAASDDLHEGPENGAHGHGLSAGGVHTRSPSAGKSDHADQGEAAGAADGPGVVPVVALGLLTGSTPAAMGADGHSPAPNG